MPSRFVMMKFTGGAIAKVARKGLEFNFEEASNGLQQQQAIFEKLLPTQYRRNVKTITGDLDTDGDPPEIVDSKTLRQRQSEQLFQIEEEIEDFRREFREQELIEDELIDSGQFDRSTYYRSQRKKVRYVNWRGRVRYKYERVQVPIKPDPFTPEEWSDIQAAKELQEQKRLLRSRREKLLRSLENQKRSATNRERYQIRRRAKLAAEQRFNAFIQQQKPQVVEGVKANQREFERNARNFISKDPEILFCVEYIIQGEFKGVLVVWEKYEEISSHYSVFKKNLFQSDSEFERILFLDVKNLEEETEYFIDYVNGKLGFNQLITDNVYVILDTKVKEDRIYEYRVSAAFVPKSVSEIDYDMALESKGLLYKADVGGASSSNVFSFAGAVLGNKNLAWTVSACDERLAFFGRSAAENSLSSILSSFKSIYVNVGQVYVPKNTNDIMEIFKTSASLFGVKDSFIHFVKILGGLSDRFIELLLNSGAVDEDLNSFYYEKFSKSIKQEFPVFNNILQIAESIAESGDTQAIESLSSLSIAIPDNTGSESLMVIDGLSRVLKFINDVFLAVLYSQDRQNFDKLDEILVEVDVRSAQVEADAASQVILEQIEDISGEIEDIQTSQIDLLEEALEEDSEDNQSVSDFTVI